MDKKVANHNATADEVFLYIQMRKNKGIKQEIRNNSQIKNTLQVTVTPTELLTETAQQGNDFASLIIAGRLFYKNKPYPSDDNDKVKQKASAINQALDLVASVIEKRCTVDRELMDNHIEFGDYHQSRPFPVSIPTMARWLDWRLMPIDNSKEYKNSSNMMPIFMRAQSLLLREKMLCDKGKNYEEEISYLDADQLTVYLAFAKLTDNQQLLKQIKTRHHEQLTLEVSQRTRELIKAYRKHYPIVYK